MVTKGEAVQRLRDARFDLEANALELWRNIIGTNSGWDGWIRKEYPHVIDVIWPE